MTLDQLKALLRDVLEKEKEITRERWVAETGVVPDLRGRALAIIRESHTGKCASICVIAKEEHLTKEDRANAAFIALARNVSPAMAKALLGEIEELDAQVNGPDPHINGFVRDYCRKRLAAILAQFTQTPTL